jgi:hypothetical protein
VALPNVDLNLSLEDYVRMLCVILDIPVYDGSIVESLHVFFTLYLEFKSNQVGRSVGHRTWSGRGKQVWVLGGRFA